MEGDELDSAGQKKNYAPQESSKIEGFGDLLELDGDSTTPTHSQPSEERSNTS